MTTLTFDTLKFVEHLVKAGVPEAHAKAEAEALADVFSTGAQSLATRADLRELELRIDAKISDAKADIIKWMAGLMIAQAGLVAALVKMLIH